MTTFLLLAGVCQLLALVCAALFGDASRAGYPFLAALWFWLGGLLGAASIGFACVA